MERLPFFLHRSCRFSDRFLPAFAEKRLDKLFSADAVDITSDVQVLEQMLQKDGLAGEQLKIEL